MKPLIKFKKNLYIDAKNWWEANNKISYGCDWSLNCPEHILKKIKGKEFNEVKDFLKKEIVKYYAGYEFIKKEVEPYFKIKERKIIKRLEEIHKKPFPIKYVDVYYTSFKRCPYGYKSNKFWININEYNKDKDFLSLVITHELMHLFFEKYYWKYCEEKGLSQKQIADIKEAFSVLLNIEFKDIFNSNDTGYKSHKELRIFISKEWIKYKDFEKALDSVCEYVKSII